MNSTLIYEKNILNEVDLIQLIDEMKSNLTINSIILLSGEMGSGKTTWTHYFCEAFNIKNVQSPTYSIHQRYENDQIIIDHFDLYRLKNDEDIDSTGFWDIMSDIHTTKIIEWPEKIQDELWFESYMVKQNIFKLQITLRNDFRFFQLFKLN